MNIPIAPVRVLSQTLLSRSQHLLLRATLSTNPLLRVSHSHSSQQKSPATSRNFLLESALPSRSRFYATAAQKKPVSRPKAHTGRTPAKRSNTSQRTSGASTSGRRTTRRKATVKKAKAKPVKKRTISKTAQKKLDTQKARGLKERALLNPPKLLPATAWAVLFSENATKGTPINGDAAKSAAQKYRNLNPEEHERLNHTANENKAQNAVSYKRWLSTYTPRQIKDANNARNQLRNQARKEGKKKTYPHIKDDRLVKQSRNSYTFFLSTRVASGDLNNMKVSEIGPLVSREWKSLSAADKKQYEDMAARDRNRYLEEVKSVYGDDPSTARK